jgi:hypothetical protein
MKRKAAAFTLGFMFLLQTESSSGLNYEAYKIFLQGDFNLKTGHIGDGIKIMRKLQL